MKLKTFLKRHKYSTFKLDIVTDLTVYYSGKELLGEVISTGPELQHPKLGEGVNNGDLHTDVVLLMATYELLLIEGGEAFVTGIFLIDDSLDNK